MKCIFTFLMLTVLFFSCKENTSDTLDPTVTGLSPSERLDQLSDIMLTHIEQFAPDSTKIPRSGNTDGTAHLTGSRDWTSGFFPGILWQLYDHSREQQLQEAATAWTTFVEKEKWDDHTHDLGFKLYCSFGKGYEITDDQAYKDVLIQASKTLIDRYNEKVGCIRSWDFNADKWEFPVIIDNMMNLDMLFEATRLTGDSIYHNIAYTHAKTTLKNHFRADNSSYHVVVYDTLSGDATMKVTHQGLSDESSWSRGQAWGLYGYTLAYRWTKDPDFLEQATKIASYFTQHPNLPSDHIPYWDFDAPNIPDEPRDVSAATVAASALLELAKYDASNEAQYLSWVDQVFDALVQEAYQADIVPFLLDQSTGSVPGGTEIDVPIIYGDYYYVEALLRKKNY